jgi:hypothetical protein
MTGRIVSRSIHEHAEHTRMLASHIISKLQWRNSVARSSTCIRNTKTGIWLYTAGLGALELPVQLLHAIHRSPAQPQINDLL